MQRITNTIPHTLYKPGGGGRRGGQNIEKKTHIIIHAGCLVALVQCRSDEGLVVVHVVDYRVPLEVRPL